MPFILRPFRRFPVWSLCVLLAVLTPSPAAAVSEYHGLVVRVLDGDTLEVLHNQHPERIRLNGIDCPEKGQPYGHQAKQATSAMVFGKEVILQTHGRDKSGYTLADGLLPDGSHVNHTLVKNGWCWWYRKYAPRNTELARLEQNARETKKGLWVGQTHIPPWQWRKRTH